MPQQVTIQQAFELAVQQRAAGRRAEAESIYRQILAAQPDHPAALHNLGALMLEAGDSSSAIPLLEQAIRLRPDVAHYHCNLGIALRNAARVDAAIASYQRAAELDRNDPSIWYNLGNARAAMDHFSAAIEAYEHALQLKPDYADAHCNLGNTYNLLGNAEASIAAYRRAIAIKSDLAAAQYGLGVALLRKGDFTAGWPGYEWRWDIPASGLSRLNIPRPMWDGSELRGQHILLHAEQGLGDTIMIARYTSLIRQRGAGRITLVCQQELMRLLRGGGGFDAVITGGDPIPPFDLHCPLMSAPMVCNTTPQAIPADVPYLKPDPDDVDRWKQRIGGEKHLKVGLAWSGKPTHLRDRDRTIALSVLAPLGQLPGIRFFSLQKGKGAEQASSPPPGMNLTDWSNDLRDMADTAALMANLDLVIAVDTSVVHLAGALGKAVWVLLPHVPDWRWLMDRSDSPWYPTMRLFRQARRADWSDPVMRVTNALQQERKSKS